MSEDALALARDMIEALDDARQDREQWVASARLLHNGPMISIGPYSTKNQALKALGRLSAADSGPDVGGLVHRMNSPAWLDKKG